MSHLEVAVKQAIEGAPPSADTARALWSERAEMKTWPRQIDRAIDEQGGASYDDRTLVLAWIRDSARAAFGVDHEAAIAFEVFLIAHAPGDDGGFEDAKDLYRRAPSPHIAHLAMKGAFTSRDYAAAEHYARLAGDRRGLGAALLHLGRWDEGFAVFDEALAQRGPLFGGEGVTVSPAIDDARESAISEAASVARWASATTPEWVRALGGICEAFDAEPSAERSRQRFVAALAHLESLDDFEVVIRQLRERNMLRAARIAAHAGCNAFPDDSWIHSVHGNLARAAGDGASALASYRRAAEILDASGSPDAGTAWMNVADAATTAGDPATASRAFDRAAALTPPERALELEFYRVRALRGTNPSEALDRALALVARLANDPHEIAETDVGHAATDLAIELALDANDRRALDVQQKLLDAKFALWGECPAVWLERHNLGTVFVQLGDTGRARELITAARARLAAQFGEMHEQVRLCDRSLARLNAGSS